MQATRVLNNSPCRHTTVCTVPLVNTEFDQTIVCVDLVLQVNVPLRAYLSTHPDLRIVSVACGHSHTLAIAETGSVWSCGRNGDGQ
mgnify:CR=1 FL=1